MTFQDAIAEGVGALSKAGVATPQTDARQLICVATGVRTDRLTLHLRDSLSDQQSALFQTLIAKRVNRVPVSHLVGGRQFYGRWFRVTPDVLDPRPETETLVSAALETRFSRVLDLGTGSGALLLSLLAERNHAHGVGVDISEKAIAVAQDNAKEIGLADRSRLMTSDWFSHVDGLFDLVVSNPPYIAVSEMDSLQPEVRDHEPRLALTDGADGLLCYRQITKSCGTYLQPHGWMMVEIGPTQGAAVSGMFAEAGLTNIRIIPDLDGRNRVVAGQKPA